MTTDCCGIPETEKRRQVVIVTGAAGGIGRSCAEAFLTQGAVVIAVDSDRTALMDLTATTSHNRLTAATTNVAEPSQVAELYEDITRRWGRVDVLVNNAARLGPFTSVDHTDLAEFEATVAVNLRGTFLMTQHAFPLLKKTRGAIVNVSSMAGKCGEKDHAVYAMTKGGINALTQSTAIDWGAYGIRCNAVCPSSVGTPNVDAIISALPNAEEVAAYRQQTNHLRYNATPIEIANVVMFLASPAASFMTGAVVPASGGSECGYGLKA